jgi:hypothetical protein
LEQSSDILLSQLGVLISKDFNDYNT